MPITRDTRQLIQFLLLGALVGVIGGVLMALFTMLATATYLQMGFFTPLYAIAAPLIGHLEHGMSSVEICHEYDLTPEQVMAVKQLSQEQVQYIKGYADALENVVISTPTT